VLWRKPESLRKQFSTVSRSRNADGSPALSNAELAEKLLDIAWEHDGGAPKTGRRFYYLSLSLGWIQPDMSATDAGKKSRDAAYERVTKMLLDLRMRGDLPWVMVLDLTREIDEWRMYRSPRDAREQLRDRYDEDRWLGQPFYPIFVVEKDTMQPVCQPMARDWQMPFASSRGYSGGRLQYDVAQLLLERWHRYGQRAVVFFISDFDPSGLDLQRDWEEKLYWFGVRQVEFVRIGLTAKQIEGRNLERLGIEVKRSDTRSKEFLREYGERFGGLCWETDVLPAEAISAALDAEIEGRIDRATWQRAAAEIETNRALL
jgi:hypothetical protein